MKKWKKLTKKEKGCAINNIQNYYDSLNDKKYCKKARTYLNDKSFNDEFKNNGNIKQPEQTEILKELMNGDYSKMMKKFINIFCVLFLTISLNSCGEKETEKINESLPKTKNLC